MPDALTQQVPTPSHLEVRFGQMTVNSSANHCCQHSKLARAGEKREGVAAISSPRVRKHKDLAIGIHSPPS